MRKTFVGVIVVCGAAISAGLLFTGCAGMFFEKNQLAEELPFMIKNGDKVVFYGDSITDDQWYPTFIRAFVATRHPEWRNTFLNRGFSGDRTSSLKRFERDVVEQKPDVALFMMGYNDLRYGKLSSKWLETFLENVEESILMLRARSPKTKVLLVSSPLNETVVSYEPCWGSPKSYPYALLMLDREEKKLAEKLNVPFLEMGMKYGSLVGLGEVVGQETFALSRDGVHPQQEGQLLIVAFMLEKMKADGLVAETVIDSVNAVATKTLKCAIKNATWSCDGDFVFERRCEILPFPIPPMPRTFAFLANVDEKLNRDILRITRLDSKAYELYIDERKVAVLRADDLEKGVDLSKFSNTPMNERALKVLAAARKLDKLKTKMFLLIRAGKLDGFGRPTPDTPPMLATKLPDMLKAIESAKIAVYSKNKTKWCKFKLTPTVNVPNRFAALVDNPLNQSHMKITASPLKVNVNEGQLESGELSLTISNSNTTAKKGSVKWGGTGWSIQPKTANFTVAANAKITLKFKVAYSGKADGVLSPKAEIRWKWSENWPYPRIETFSPRILPILTIGKRERTIEVNGELKDWKAKSMIKLDGVELVDNAVPGKRKLWDGPADLSADIGLTWDDKALYVAVAVKDSSHLQRKSGKRIWCEDCVFLSFQMDPVSPSKGRYEFAFARGAERDILVKYKDASKFAKGHEIRFKSRISRNPAGINYEVAIPWSRLAPFKPASGKSFRFTVTVNDADEIPGKGFNYIEWTPGVNYGEDPRKFGKIILK